MADEQELSQVDAIVGRNVREFREASGLTQRALAQRLRDAGWQIDTTALTRIENGTRSVRVNQLVLIARALDVDVTELLDDDQAAVDHLREEVNVNLRSARHFLVKGLAAAEQVAQRTSGSSGGDVLGGDAGLAYLDYVRERVAAWAVSSDAPRTIVSSIADGDAAHALIRIVEALATDVVDVADAAAPRDASPVRLLG